MVWNEDESDFLCNIFYFGNIFVKCVPEHYQHKDIAYGRNIHPQKVAAHAQCLLQDVAFLSCSKMAVPLCLQDIGTQL